MSVVIKPIILVVFLMLFLSCASSLEYSLANIDSGNYVKAEKYLLEYCDKFTKEDLLYPDPRSGVSFFVVLERLGSKETLEKVYQRKFSRANTPLLTGGQFSVRLIKLGIKCDLNG